MSERKIYRKIPEVEYPAFSNQWHGVTPWGGCLGYLTAEEVSGGENLINHLRPSNFKATYDFVCINEKSWYNVFKVTRGTTFFRNRPYIEFQWFTGIDKHVRRIYENSRFGARFRVRYVEEPAATFDELRRELTADDFAAWCVDRGISPR